MVWASNSGFFKDMEIIDYADDIVVHITAGVTVLTVYLYIGPRIGYAERTMPPHNLPLTVVGTG